MAVGDAAPMSVVWAQGFEASAQHPIGGRDEGYDAVIASFAKVAGIAGGGDIKLLEQKIDAGSDMAIESGTLVIAGYQASPYDQRVQEDRRRLEAHPPPHGPVRGDSGCPEAPRSIGLTSTGQDQGGRSR